MQRHSLNDGLKNKIAFIMKHIGFLLSLKPRQWHGSSSCNFLHRVYWRGIRHMHHTRWMHGKNFLKAPRMHSLWLQMLHRNIMMLNHFSCSLQVCSIWAFGVHCSVGRKHHHSIRICAFVFEGGDIFNNILLNGFNALAGHQRHIHTHVLIYKSVLPLANICRCRSIRLHGSGGT